MAKAHEFVLAGGVINALHRAGSWCGETHIQKSCYIAKHLKSVDFESHFILYKHGPYSFDLSSTLNSMRAQNIVSVTPRNYGSTYELNLSLWSALDRAAGCVFYRFEDDINRICLFLAKKNVAELERVATAVFVCLNFPDLEKSKKSLKLRELKPHISLPEADLAFHDAANI